MRYRRLAGLIAAGMMMAGAASADTVRARDLGVPFAGTPGAYNAITDVAGVEVGYVSLISGEGKLERGKGPVRTGVTAVLPRGKESRTPVYAGWDTSNAAGEMTGTVWLEERGLFDGPVMITNTHSVGVVRDAVVKWLADVNWPGAWFAPIVAETYDGRLNDINGFHVKTEHAIRAIETAASGPVAEGNVGGGVGMQCFGFKGGTGTASRVVEVDGKAYTVGVLVQCNFGMREWLRVAGAPVGEDLAKKYLAEKPAVETAAHTMMGPADGSIIVVMATDVPMLPHQLKRLAKRAAAGMGRMGDAGSDGSGDIFVAFSTANGNLASVGGGVISVETLSNEKLTPIFEAATQATEEAITNVLVAAETMTGANGYKVHRLPHAELRAILKKYGRLAAE
ncbi:P1 family peptidase [Sphingosinicella soli]|uniref:L-aminopeptidase/D-esterase-like protein n=1 Tax=Sphingosinicella soli TaxID=333708 RepID=A0A7W7B3Q7_9SPHN|nr:P1 family peptidase [Sphingosinicella soli]MBB4633447.1 L-aminopeptidase/D-esterase-like protein [Sphingosinicella soli]